MTALRTLQARSPLREQAIEALASLVQEDMPETLVNEATQRLLALVPPPARGAQDPPRAVPQRA